MSLQNTQGKAAASGCNIENLMNKKVAIIICVEVEEHPNYTLTF